ncbi:glycosyltransferase 87 family protein [Pseudarthrobacter enclensis]|uniref:glycosyltransferase 87 family protein n=1 Tax=Pseudarthrobacter enclensis TaxID=993070 RepID=UPI003438760E
MNMKKLLLWDIPRIVFPLLVAVVIFGTAMQDGLDLSVYWAGARELVTGGDLYAGGLPGTPYGGMAFTYPPFAAALMAPLAFLPLNAALIFQTMGNLMLAGVSGWLIARYLTAKRVLSGSVDSKRLWITVACITGLLLLLGPWRNSLALGQINPLLMALIAVDLLISTKRHPKGLLPRGVLTGIAAGIKLTPLVFMLYFVVRGDLKGTVRMLATFAGTAILMALLAPTLSRQYWLVSLSDTSRVGNLARFENISIRGFLARLELDPSAASAIWICAALVVTALGARAVYTSRKLSDPWGGVAATALVMLLVSPVSWGHHWVWVAICIAAVLGRAAETLPAPRKWRLLLASPAGALCLLLVAGFALQPVEAAKAAGSPNPYSSISMLSEMAAQSGLFAAVLALIWFCRYRPTSAPEALVAERQQGVPDNT